MGDALNGDNETLARSAHTSEPRIDGAKAPNLREVRLYLDLLKRALNNYLYLGGRDPFDDYFPLAGDRYDRDAFQWRIPECCIPHTVLMERRFDRLEELIVDVVERSVPGDLIEAGAWRGGATIYMRGLLRALSVPDRIVWVADSFEGIPHSVRKERDVVDDWKDRWIASYESVRATFARYGLLDAQVRFIKGRFGRSLCEAPLTELAIVRIDADSYESTLAALEELYPKISVGGYVYVDDWHLTGCREAVHKYRDEHGIDEPIDEHVDAVWRVEKSWDGRTGSGGRERSGGLEVRTSRDETPARKERETIDEMWMRAPDVLLAWKRPGSLVAQVSGAGTEAEILPDAVGLLDLFSRPCGLEPGVEAFLDAYSTDDTRKRLATEVWRLIQDWQALGLLVPADEAVAQPPRHYEEPQGQRHWQ